MLLFLAAIAALGGLAFWRRHTLKDDAAKAAAAGKDAAAKAVAAGKDTAAKVTTRVHGDAEAEGRQDTDTDAAEAEAGSGADDSADESE